MSVLLQSINVCLMFCSLIHNALLFMDKTTTHDYAVMNTFFGAWTWVKVAWNVVFGIQMTCLLTSKKWPSLSLSFKVRNSECAFSLIKMHLNECCKKASLRSRESLKLSAFSMHSKSNCCFRNGEMSLTLELLRTETDREPLFWPFNAGNGLMSAVPYDCPKAKKATSNTAHETTLVNNNNNASTKVRNGLSPNSKRHSYCKKTPLISTSSFYIFRVFF